MEIVKLKFVYSAFLCRLRSIAAHRDHFVWHLSVCLSGCHTFLVVTQSYVSQTTHTFLGMLTLCLENNNNSYLFNIGRVLFNSNMKGICKIVWVRYVLKFLTLTRRRCTLTVRSVKILCEKTRDHRQNFCRFFIRGT